VKRTRTRTAVLGTAVAVCLTMAPASCAGGAEGAPALPPRLPPPPLSVAAAPTGSQEPTRQLVDDALERYDRALTDLAAEPLAASAPGTPQRAAWDSAVVAGSQLSTGMAAALVRRQQHDRMVVRPGPGGLSYVHRALVVEVPAGDTVSFTWCGYSPGIGIDVDTAEVLYDTVGHAHGTGQLRRIGGDWVLEALDEFGLQLLPPGSADPCPAEVPHPDGEQGRR
jgi:hypothetical protein